MSAAANELAPETKKAEAAEKAASAADSDRALVESDTDTHETMMTYGHGKLPKFVLLIWTTFLVSFAIYMVKYFLPDLSLWGKP